MHHFTITQSKQMQITLIGLYHSLKNILNSHWINKHSTCKAIILSTKNNILLSTGCQIQTMASTLLYEPHCF